MLLPQILVATTEIVPLAGLAGDCAVMEVVPWPAVIVQLEGTVHV